MSLLSPFALAALALAAPLEPPDSSVAATASATFAPKPGFDRNGKPLTFPSCPQPQSPRDVSEGSKGELPALFSTAASIDGFTQVNTHFHLGTEHYSADEYDLEPSWDKPKECGDWCATHEFNGKPSPWTKRCTFKDCKGCDECPKPEASSEAHEEVRRGYKCADGASDLYDSYDFQYCTNVNVGETYELHYVYSTGGLASRGLIDGLGGAYAMINNPTIVVRAQVFQVVNDPAYAVSDLLHGWNTTQVVDGVRYLGSTTGTSFNNEGKCSPHAITWQVDRSCHKVHAESFDAMCKQMKEVYKMVHDTQPHGCRELVAPELVVRSEFVVPIAGVESL